jgi:hypothetical protein
MSTRNIKIIMFLESNVRRCVGLTALPPSVSRLFIQCGILNITQPYRPPRPVTGIALLYFTLLIFPAVLRLWGQMSIRFVPGRGGGDGGKVWPARKLTTSPTSLNCLENVGA